MPFPPKNDLEARLYLDRLARLSTAGLISEPERAAILAAFSAPANSAEAASNMGKAAAPPKENESPAALKDMAARKAPNPPKVDREEMAPTTESLMDGALGVDVGSYRTPQRALRSWSEIRDAIGELMVDLRPRIVRTSPTEADGPVRFQLRLGPLADSAAITSLCDELRGRGLYCAPTTL